MIRHLACLPEIVRQWKKSPSDVGNCLLQKATSHFTAVQTLAVQSRSLLDDLERQHKPPYAQSSVTAGLHAALQRRYSFCLGGTLILHRLLRALSRDGSSLATEAAILVAEAVALAARADNYKPFGSAHMQFTLAAAYLDADSEEQKSAVKRAICPFQFDCTPYRWDSRPRGGLQWLDDMSDAFPARA